jgi:hypothetical protein
MSTCPWRGGGVDLRDRFLLNHSKSSDWKTLGTWAIKKKIASRLTREDVCPRAHRLDWLHRPRVWFVSVKIEAEYFWLFGHWSDWMVFCCVGRKKIDRFLRGSLTREGRLNLFWNVQIYFRNLVDWWTAKDKKKDITRRCGQIATKKWRVCARERFTRVWAASTCCLCKFGTDFVQIA